MILTKQTCKAARMLLEWKANDLADAAGISPDTVRSFESGRTKSLSASNQEAVIRAFEAEGIQFLDNGDLASGPGVALKK